MGTALVLCCHRLRHPLHGRACPWGPSSSCRWPWPGWPWWSGWPTPTGATGSSRSSTRAPTTSGTGYQVWQSLIGLGSGRIFGLGLGGGRQKWGGLPNAHTDFIFSVVGEELGLVGAVLLLGLFFLLAWFGLRAATRAPTASAA